MNNFTNVLSKDKYLFQENLQLSIENSKLYVDDTYKSNDNIYVVMIRVFNNKDKVLVYSYIRYHEMFYLTLLYFVAQRNKFYSQYREPGNLLSVIDRNISHETEENLFILENLNHISLRKYLFNKHKPLTTRDIFGLINELVAFLDQDSIIELINLAFNKNYVSFIEKMLGSTEYYENLVENLKDSCNILPVSILSGCVFVVKDIDQFVKAVNMHYNFNPGPKSYRGHINSLNNSISQFDREYRKSLYNHNDYHLRLGSIPSRFKLYRDKFSFNNIHLNINKARFISTLSKENVKNRENLLDIAYKDIFALIEEKKNSISLSDLQKEIEDLIFKGQYWFNEEYPKNNHISYNEKTYKFLNMKKNMLKSLLLNPDIYTGKTDTHATEYILQYKIILNEIGADKVSDILIQYLLYIFTNETTSKLDGEQTPGITSLNCFNILGKRIVNIYLYSKYSKINNESITLLEFKNNDKLYKEVIKLDNSFNAKIGGLFIHSLLELKLIKLVYEYKTTVDDIKMHQFVRLTCNSRNIIMSNKNQTIFHLPSKLPMIYPPKKYIYKGDKAVQLGGYLLNNIKFAEEIFIDKIGYGKNTLLKNNSIVDMINGLSRTPYKINVDTLNFINERGVDKGIVININSKENKIILEKLYKSSNTNKMNKQYLSLVSKIKLEKNILNIAGTYSSVDNIYFPVRLDQRTRIYCITDFFDYQKNDLAKGLISFSKPGVMYKSDDEEIKYFKAYGANMYGNSLDKKSLNYRVNWINDNTEYIIDFEKNDIINKSENKTCFLSFCFEYKRFLEFMIDKEAKKFYTYLPIQLDATCNGYQHLSLLTREKNLFNKLNLSASTHDDDPDDFYTYILNLTSKYISTQISILSNKKDLSEKEIKCLNSYNKLSKIKINRSIVKKTIMTMSYNASIPTLVSQIINNLDLNETKNGIDEDGNTLNLKRADIVIFVLAIKYVINKESPKIKELSKYLDGIVSICTKLNIPIPWLLPHSGAEVRQSYEVEKSISIKAFFFINTKYTFKKYQRGVYDLTKQKRATMPNFIHSLDASTIAMLYKKFKDVSSLYTIHDCFGVTADCVPRLMFLLKMVYIQLYSSSSYLIEFDKYVKTTINKTFGDSVYKMNQDFINIDNKNKIKTISMPNIKNVLDESIDINCIKDSSNLIV